jgi:hypothetical protein
MPAENAAAAAQLVNLRFYIVRVLESDGSHLAHWSIARELLLLGDATLQQYYRQYREELDDQPLAELIVGIKIVEQLRETLRWLDDEDLQYLNQYADWFRIKAKLRLVMPLVERLLEEAGVPAEPHER